MAEVRTLHAKKADSRAMRSLPVRVWQWLLFAAFMVPFALAVAYVSLWASVRLVGLIAGLF